MVAEKCKRHNVLVIADDVYEHMVRQIKGVSTFGPSVPYDSFNLTTRLSMALK